MPLDYDLASLILPIELLPYFEVVRVDKHEERIDLFLDECNNPPKQPYTYLSKGFTDERLIQDFPLRGRAVFLHVRKRKYPLIYSYQNSCHETKNPDKHYCISGFYFG